uniref:Zona pellucida sperm-binding protein 3 n=1 Tax=Pogona vitticeps TaxID=103695 RepID=A0ABM5EXV4_9SAUR
MGLLKALALVCLCWAVWEGAAFDSWDGVFRNPVGWRSSAARTDPSVGQPYALSWSQNYPQAWVDPSQPRILSPLTPVAAQCGEAQVVVTVNRDLFGTGRPIKATDLTLGSLGCQPTSYDAAQDLVTFAVGLHECGSTLQMTPESLVYSISLYYNPTPSASAIILRTSPAEVPIECHYPRKNNVSSKAIKPTWVPFTSTLSAEEKLSFFLRLMNEDWSAERVSNGYQLGDVMHIQADVNTENHVPLRLFVDNCVATLSPGRDSTPQYSIIDYKGCLIDGRSDASSAFLSPRLREDSLRFTVEVFRFSEDPRDLIYITCHLKVSAVDRAPDHEHKACSFNKASDSWIPVEGTQSICACCESRNCEQGQPRRLRPWDRWERGRRSVGEEEPAKHNKLKEVERDVMLGPILILDAYMTSRSLAGRHTGARGTLGEEDLFRSPGMLAGLILMAIAMILALATLGTFCSRRKRSGSP